MRLSRALAYDNRPFLKTNGFWDSQRDFSAIGWRQLGALSRVSVDAPSVCLTTGIPSEILCDVACDVRAELT